VASPCPVEDATTPVSLGCWDAISVQLAEKNHDSEHKAREERTLPVCNIPFEKGLEIKVRHCVCSAARIMRCDRRGSRACGSSPPALQIRLLQPSPLQDLTPGQLSPSSQSISIVYSSGWQVYCGIICCNSHASHASCHSHLPDHMRTRRVALVGAHPRKAQVHWHTASTGRTAALPI
jgi:hypothetical protein